jgi:hypothetical protein
MAVLIVGLLCHALVAGGSAALFAEIFDTRVRYSGTPSDTSSGAFAGGAFAPLIAVRLLEIYKSVVPIAIHVALAATLTLVEYRAFPAVRTEMSQSLKSPGLLLLTL